MRRSFNELNPQQLSGCWRKLSLILVGGGLYKRNDEESQLCVTKINWALKVLRDLQRRDHSKQNHRTKGRELVTYWITYYSDGICEDQ